MEGSQPKTPGERIREELKARGWTQSDLASILGRPFPTINEIIAGKKAITAETAIQLGIAFQNDPGMWMQLESAYRLAQAQPAPEPIQRRARLHSLAPIKDMAKRNWIKDTDDIDDLEQELKNFFGVDSLDTDPVIDAMPRKSTAGDLSPSQRAWCFRAKGLAKSVNAKKYDEELFGDCLKRLRTLAAYPEEIRKVPRVLGSHGIRLVIVEPLPKTRIDGVAFWLNESSPVVALSMRYDRIDYFWHTLGHELSHIRHRDTTVVDTDLASEENDSDALESDVEKRADHEAASSWINEGEIEDFIRRVGPIYSTARINQFANRIRVHPGIIVGQIHHKKRNFSTHREMLIKVREKVTSESLADGWGHSIARAT